MKRPLSAVGFLHPQRSRFLKRLKCTRKLFLCRSFSLLDLLGYKVDCLTLAFSRCIQRHRTFRAGDYLRLLNLECSNEVLPLLNCL